MKFLVWLRDLWIKIFSSAPAPTQPPAAQPAPWLEFAQGELGIHELSGVKDTPRIMWYFSHTSYEADHDEVPWCAAFVCACLESVGYRGTRNAAAVSFASDKFGPKCELKPGAIVVFEWADGSHHVSICESVGDDGTLECLGGNQANMVKVSKYARKFVISSRWPQPKQPK